MSEFAAIGQPKPIIDGQAKVMGKARYIADLHLPGMLHARFVPSMYAHAHIKGIDTSEALAVPGVVRVLTHEDLPKLAPSSRRKLLLARGRVIFVGQPVAVVLATSEAAAADGAERVLVDYEVLPAAMTIDAALAKDAPLVWPEGIPKGSEDASEHGADVGQSVDTGAEATNIDSEDDYTRGNIEAGFAEADIIVEHSFTTPMVHQSSIETHGIVAQPDLASGGINIWCSTQAPFDVRNEVADVLEMPETLIRAHGEVIGGGFGGKFPVYEPLVAAMAVIAGQPVKLILTRSEELMATNPAPAIRVQARLGAKKDGTLTALQAKIDLDAGSYPANLASFAGFQLGSFFPVPNMDIHTTEVLTFKPGTGAYRAPCAPTAFFVMGTLIDEIAAALDMDSIDVLLKNVAAQGALLANDKTWPGIGAKETLEALKQHPVWQNREQLRAQGHGVGIAIGGWMGGTSPGMAACGLNRDGMIHIHTGSMDISGTNTSLILMAAEAFGVSPDMVKLVQGDTDNAPYSTGTGGSKMLYATGKAVVAAAQDARQQVMAVAAELFEAAPEDMEIVDGSVRIKGLPSQAITLKELAKKTMGWGKYAPIQGNGRTVVTDQSPAFNAQLVEVDVDQETGEVKVLKLISSQDVGRAINPLAIQGQIMGGATQGLGWALYEQILYDEDGQLLTGSWMDYTMPKAAQTAQEIETIIVEVPSEHGPFGARGVGEPPVTPTAAAVANAIAHATGVRLTNIPMTAPTVLEALQAAEN